MSKKIILIIIILANIAILSIIGISCIPSESSQFIIYIDEENGFSISHPENWHVETPISPPELKVSIWEKKIGLNPVGIMVGKYVAPGYSLEDFAKFRKDFLSNTTENYFSISTGKLTISGIPTIKHIYVETVGQTTYKSIEVYLVDDGTGWIVRFNSPEKSFDFYKTIYDTALSSFSLLK